MRRAAVVILGFSVLVSPAYGQEPGSRFVWWPSRTVPRDQPYRPPTPGQRLDLLIRGTYLNPTSYFRAAAVAGIDHWQNDPPQWGSDIDGLKRRLGDRFARFTIRDTIEAGWAGAIGHEVRYIPCQCSGGGRRVWHAFAGGFRTWNREGQWRPHYSRIGSTFGAEYIRYSWQPPERRDASDIPHGVGIQLAVGVSGRLLREFSPEINGFFRKAFRRPAKTK